MAHLRVMSAIINSIREEEVLLDSGSQIVSMTKKVATANKVSWDSSLSIQMQSANRLLSRIYRLARNISFTLEGVMVLLQVHVRRPLTHDPGAPLPSNIISLCNSQLSKNGIQGYFSIYCRLFPPRASSNSLRNLLEMSCNIFYTIIYLRNLLEYTAPVALTVCRCLTEWKVVFDHSWKTALIASAASDFLHKKATL